MDIMEKIKILSGAAKYDVSCSSSGSKRKNNPGGIGNAEAAGICHSWAEDGRCISLLKILYTNYCIYDCSYCLNRKSNDVPRAAFTVDEIVNLTVNFYRRNYIEGLFLSSGVIKSPDHTMEELYLIAKKLRVDHNFNGYIHLKIIPGASQELVRRAGLYADRISVNIELPSEESLVQLAPDKKKSDIIKPMSFITNGIEENKHEKRFIKSAPTFAPAGQSTQMIVGATKESDKHIITLAENMYKKFSMKRVYYSAYVPTTTDKRLPNLKEPPLIRENRLYQADWLMRFYGFKADEILDEKNPFLEEELDPKTAWALRNMHFFPVDINRADYETLLRVPGIGVRSAQRIIIARRSKNLDFENLKKIGVVIKRAKYFVTSMGKYLERVPLNMEIIKSGLIEKKPKDLQLRLFQV